MNFITTRVVIHRGRFAIRHGQNAFKLLCPLGPCHEGDTRYCRKMTRQRSDQRIRKTRETWAPPQIDNHQSGISTGHQYSYHQAMNNVLSGKKFQAIQSSLESQGIWSKDVSVMFREWLLTNDSVIDNDEDEWSSDPFWKVERHHSANTHQSSFMDMLNIRRNKFQRQMLESKSKGLRRKDMSTTMTTTTTEFPASFFPMAQMVLQEVVDQCMTKRNPKVVMEAWEKIRECGVILNESSTVSLLNTMIECQNCADSTEELEWEQQKNTKCIQEAAIYLHFVYGPSDVTANLFAREWLSQGHVTLAEEALKSCVLTAQNKQDISKTYFSILEAYCNSNNVTAAVSLFRSLRRRRGLVPSLDMHLLIISTLAANGYVRKDAESIQIFDELLFSISMTVSKLEYASAKKLYNALAGGFKSELNRDIDSTMISSPLSELLTTEDIPTLTRPAKHNEVVAGRVLLDASTGTCPVTNVKLKLVSLDQDQRNELRRDLLHLATELYAKSPEYKSKDCVERAANELVKFSDWLRKKRCKHYTAIVDGPNVGFYMRKYSNGKFSYRQIQAVVSGLEANGERPLVILPHKYTKPGFLISDRYRQRLDREELDILESKEDCIDVQFLAADLFVPKIQLNKRYSASDPFDEAGGEWAGKVWHIPVKSFSANERFVVSIPEMYESG
ncbi:hypothetical protein ACHAWX_004625 [Stephanocyclus meneghinianus]